MRIIHLSDIHLCKDNIEDFRLHYRKSLIEELGKRNSEIEIELIIISGDLVDKGGASLKEVDEYKGYDNPYDIFEKEFIEPICSQLKIPKEKILFIPGNHDIEQNKIDEIKEAGLKSILKSPQDVNKITEKYNGNLDGLNFQRLHNFLEFEKLYHKDNKFLQYEFSEFESKIVYDNFLNKIGIALINDSWRCGKGKVENHFVGISQFYRCLNFFEKNKTELNIAVMHHPLDVYERNEKEEIENLLHFKKFEVLLLGHEHSKRFEGSDFGNEQKVLFTRGKSAFDKPHEKDLEYISGYTIIDLDFLSKKTKCHYKIYDKKSYKFYDDNSGGGAVKSYQYDIADDVKQKVNEKGKDFFMGIDKSKFINNPDNE
jgi:predicted phosphodiesterase